MLEQIVQLVNRLNEIRREFTAPGSSGLPTYLAASDVHGNVSRLREVLAVAQRENVDHVFLVGDSYSGPGGWSLYRMVRTLVVDPTPDAPAARISLMWGNHEVALVAGMLGNDKQLRFFLSFGGDEIVREINTERCLRGEPPVPLRTLSPTPPSSDSQSTASQSPPVPPRLTAAELARIREVPELREMASWIQRTHKLFLKDTYGTGYLHAFPKINRHGQFTVQYQGKQGIDALSWMECDLRNATSANHPVFSTLLQTDTSPVWALFEITSARQFDQALRTQGVRQIIFGHRHHTDAVNVGQFNRQIGIAVDFDRGRGGYLLLGPGGLTFQKFVDRESSQTKQTELVWAHDGHSPHHTHLRDIEEYLFGEIVKLERQQFERLPVQSAQARHEFEFLEGLRRQGVPWIHRLYAEIYLHVKDSELRKEMFTATVDSGDEDAFRSFIHLLHEKTRDLDSHGHDWYSESYGLAKSVTEVLMTALAKMPLARLGLLDVRLRGTTSRVNLMELYKRVLLLDDPDLAQLAVQNLGTLGTPEANAELRRAFFHDVRKVRVLAANVLAAHGEVAYPLVAPLLRSHDIWVRFLAMWTIAALPQSDSVRLQAIHDLRRVLDSEQDWFLYTIGKEFLRKLRDPGESFPDRLEIPNLTNTVIDTLQQIVDCAQEPFRRAFKVYFITIELSSLVYRRGLVGLDIDDLRIYVSHEDYFPHFFRFYKSGDWDSGGEWRGWRRLWIRGETRNYPDGPNIISLAANQADAVPTGERTIVLYDHRRSDGQVQLPDLDGVMAHYGLGKVKDRIRHGLLQQWSTAFSIAEQSLLCRLHAASLTKMLFDIPAELAVTKAERAVLEELSHKELTTDGQKPHRVLTLKLDDFAHDPTSHGLTAHPQWLDVPKYAVRIFDDPGTEYEVQSTKYEV